MRLANLTTSLVLVACAGACASQRGDPAPPAYLARAHAHNDYERGRPLLDALDRGFASVEVDVVLLDGELYVAHEADEVRRADTLAGLYLEPLRELTRRNGGRVFAMSDSSLQLLIDVKSDPEATYRALELALSAYEDVFTRWTGDRAERGPVTAVLSGNRPTAVMLGDGTRYVALDGRIDEDRSAFSAEAMPLVSIDWATIESLPERQRLPQVRAWIDVVHGEGRRIRFWGTPDRESVWDSLIAMGADLIGADDIGRLQRALRAR